MPKKTIPTRGRSEETRIAESISCLAEAVRTLTKLCKTEWECNRSRSGLATKEDLIKMEKRLAHAIAKITPDLESAAMSVQSALDKLDASIPDKNV